jgi:hypothetical protein
VPEVPGDKTSEGGLSLTSRAAAPTGGATGPAVIPGKPAESLLIKAVNHTGDLKMPPNGKLTPKEVEKFTLRVSRGAVWPDPGDVTKTGGRYEVLGPVFRTRPVTGRVRTTCKHDPVVTC